MKQKDIVYLLVAAIIFSIVGIIGFKQLGSSSGSQKVVKVEVITPILPDYDQTALGTLSDAAKARDFLPPIDLSTGLGNPKPFNPI